MIRRSLKSIKQLGGVLILDLPRYLLACDSSRSSWVDLRNRVDSLAKAEDGIGVSVLSNWSSVLHAPQVLPFLKKKLIKRCLRDHQFVFRDEPAEAVGQRVPEISFVIGHRGVKRLPLLLRTLRSIAGQTGVVPECIVVEQSEAPLVASELPAWVRYVHSPCAASAPYNRAQTFNLASRHARSRLLVLHDNDMLVPANYATELLSKVALGFEVVNIKRFVFYADQASTEVVLGQDDPVLSNVQAESVVQNLLAGASLAILKEAYEEIGGLDEGFVGWGYEDVEFWERACTRRVWNYAYLPMVHLWHEPQPGKSLGEKNPTMERLRSRMHVPAEQRILEVRAANKGYFESSCGIEHVEGDPALDAPSSKTR